MYRTFFWAALTIQPDKADAQGIFDVLKGHFEASDVSMSKVFFYASDGASVVYSEGGGVPGLFQREVNPKLLRVHCLSHRCALVLKDSVEKSEWALWCDEIMHDIINPFARSSRRCKELEKVQEEMELVKLVVLRLVITRWLSRGQCLHRICLIYPALVRVFKSDPERQALYAKMTSYYFVGTMALMDDILQLANAINTLFQAKHVYIKFAMDEVKKNIKMLQDMFVSDGLRSPSWLRLHEEIKKAKDAAAAASTEWDKTFEYKGVKITWDEADDEKLAANCKDFVREVIAEMNARFPDDLQMFSIFDWTALPATDAELLAPLPSTYGSEELKQLIGKYKDVKESMGTKFTWDEAKLDIEWHRLRREMLEARDELDQEEAKRERQQAAADPTRIRNAQLEKKEKRARKYEAMDKFYAKVFSYDASSENGPYSAEMQFLICCYLCLVLSSVVCESSFSLMALIKTKSRNQLKMATLDAHMMLAANSALTAELSSVCMTEQELVEAALREWQKKPRYPGRSHCQSRRRSVRYQRESIQDWYEKQDFTQPLVSDSDSDEDETVLGAGGRDEDEDDEADEDGEELEDDAATEERYRGYGVYEVPHGWEVVPKAEAQELLKAVKAQKVYTRRWKIAHLFDYGWDEGNVWKKVSKGKGVDRRTLYDVNYPSDSKTVPQQLSFTGTNQYGAGGWEAEPREVWVVIRPIPSGSGGASTSRKR